MCKKKNITLYHIRFSMTYDEEIRDLFPPSKVPVLGCAHYELLIKGLFVVPTKKYVTDALDKKLLMASDDIKNVMLNILTQASNYYGFLTHHEIVNAIQALGYFDYQNEDMKQSIKLLHKSLVEVIINGFEKQTKITFTMLENKIEEEKETFDFLTKKIAN